MTSTRGLLDGLDVAGLDTALSEAVCLGLTVDAERKEVEIDLEVLTLREQTTGTSDTEAAVCSRTERVRLVFHGITRIATSLRIQKWDDPEPRVLPLEPAELSAAVAGFGGSRLHGWEFIDPDDSSWALWRELLSFDTELDTAAAPHVLEISQEEGVDPRELDIRIWFDSVSARDSAGTTIPLPELVSGSRRWWNAHDKGDPRASHPGIAPPL